MHFMGLEAGWCTYSSKSRHGDFRHSCAHEDEDVSEEHLGVEVVISTDRAPSIARVAHC